MANRACFADVGNLTFRQQHDIAPPEESLFSSTQVQLRAYSSSSYKRARRLLLRSSSTHLWPFAPGGMDADVALSLRFYFLMARIPLVTAQVQHLSSNERLVFGSAPLPRVAKRPGMLPSFL